MPSVNAINDPNALPFESRAIREMAISSASNRISTRPAFRPSTVIRLVQQVQHPLTECPAGFREFDRGCFAPEFTVMLQSASAYLGEHSGPREHIAVFPYQTMFGMASRRNVTSFSLLAAANKSALSPEIM